jgi:lipopolysaccharide/colanic/teichoic acid biosynthesis glycosyltransferase
MNTEPQAYQTYGARQSPGSGASLVLEREEAGALPPTAPRPDTVQGPEAIPAQNPPVHPAYHAGKRAVDFIGAALGLILLFPVFLLVSILVALDSPGPIFHRRRVLAQQDYHADALTTFDAFKFRTMVVNADDVLKNNPNLMAEYNKEFKLLQDPRVTRLGAKIRPLSLDELPQLINVLRGQMSLVGPRMITPPELEMYGPYAARLLSVKPGLTGLWQVSGRTNVPYHERVRLDMYYIENRSLLLDLQILWRTVGSVLARRGAV